MSVNLWVSRLARLGYAFHLVVSIKVSMKRLFLILSLSLLLSIAFASEAYRRSSGGESRVLIGADAKTDEDFSARNEECESGDPLNSTFSTVNYTFCIYKSKFDRQYVRALRDDPFLRGTVTLKLEVLGSGEVGSAEILHSDLGSTRLERRILLIASYMNFADIKPDGWRGEYTLRFYPGF